MNTSTLTMQNVENMLKKVTPESIFFVQGNSVHSILKLLDKIDTTPPVLIEEIKKDVAITGNIMRIANTPFYGLPKRVDNLGLAIKILGYDHVKNIVSSMWLLSRKVSTKIPVFYPVLTSVVAKSIASDYNIHKENIERLFMAGLFHNCASFSDSEILRSINNIGMSISDASALILEKWNFPVKITEMIRCIKTPNLVVNTNQTLTAILNISSYVVSNVIDTTERWCISDEALDILSLSKINVDDYIKQVLKNFLDPLIEEKLTQYNIRWRVK